MPREPKVYAVESLDGTYEWYLADGTPIGPPDGTRHLVQLHIRWAHYLHVELSAIAALQGLSVAELARRILTEYLRPGSWPPLDRRTAKELLNARVEHEKMKRKY